MTCSDGLIQSLSLAVKVDCSSSKCPKSGYLHSECYEKWEEWLVNMASKLGRGRSWTEQQRQHNLWTKGYDLVAKSCRCDCGGFLKRDIDWVAPVPKDNEGVDVVLEDKKKKKEKLKVKPKLNIPVDKMSDKRNIGSWMDRKQIPPSSHMKDMNEDTETGVFKSCFAGTFKATPH